MINQVVPLELTTESIMRQAIGPEFDYYQNLLNQPDSPVLIKLGGAIVETQLEESADAIQILTNLGIYPAVIHGAGPQIDTKLEDLGIGVKKIDGKRVTDEETLMVVT